MKIEVIGTPGHSADGISYRIGNVVFIGDAVPVRGDTIMHERTDSVDDSRLFHLYEIFIFSCYSLFTKRGKKE